MSQDIHVLIVGGTDSSGGAGVSRDIETVAAFGLRACVAITAVTVQTHHVVEYIEHLEPGLVTAQMRAAFSANRIGAAKIGMLGTKPAMEAVASVLAAYPSIPVVLDPVLASTSGKPLLAEDAVDALKLELLLRCSVVTPNLPELALLSGSPPALDEAELIRQARVLMDDAGSTAVLVKGGHAAGQRSIDLLLRPGLAPVRFDAPRLATQMRGTGCMLASAIAVHLADGATLETSVREAKRFVFDKLADRRGTASTFR